MTPPSTRLLHRDPTPLPLSSVPGFDNIPADAVAYQLTVQYPGRLRPHRVQTITVSLSPLQAVDRALDVVRKKSTNSIPLRLVVPGALLLPAEQSLEPTPFGAVEATFHVTALAEGALPDARLEVFRHGKVEAIPLPLRSQGTRPLAWLIALTVLIPLLLFVPVVCPGPGENGAIERAVANWFPTSPAAVGRGVQWVYTFLATTGRTYCFSFFAFLAMLGATTLWAVSRRTTVETAMGEPFPLLPPPFAAKGGPATPPPLLVPASTDDFGEIRR